MTKTALVGLHDDVLAGQVERLLRRAGYIEVTLAGDTQQMLGLIGEKGYDLYLMDLNFRAAAQDITPAGQVYDVLRRQERGHKFYGLSGYADVVSKAQQAGIPARDKTDLSAIVYDGA